MRFPGSKNLEKELRELLAVLEIIGILMAVPAFIGWTQFRPNTVGIINAWYGAYVSSTLGLGTGPFRLGWLLMVIAGVTFVIIGAPTFKSTAESPMLRVAGMSVVLTLYVASGFGQQVQINHWINDSTGGNCSISSSPSRSRRTNS